MNSELQNVYRQRLPARIESLKQLQEALSGQEPEAVEAVRRIAHSLRGSGSTYGFPRISETAACLEEAHPDDMIYFLVILLKLLEEISSEGRETRCGILIVEDDREMSYLLQQALQDRNRDIWIAGSAAEAEALLKEKPVDLMLLDLVLPDMDGRNLLMRLRQQPATALLQVIILSVKGSLQVKMECLALGADEYLEKPVDTALLSALVASRMARTAAMLGDARRDALTGLPNRAAFQDAYRHHKALALRAQEPLSLGILDIDYFKAVNDTYGHATGDRVLKQVSDLLGAALRQSDVIARWGGEEFVVLMPRTNQAGAAQALAGALERVRRESFAAADGTASFPVTFSAGVAEVQELDTLEETVAAADRLLYQAKQAGRNRVLAQPQDSRDVMPKILLAEDDELVTAMIRHRLGREGFEILHFGNGAEALAAAPGLQVDCAILDFKMPEMDGFELMRHLRRLPNFKRVPILILTSMGNEKDIVRAFDLGADDYMLKPFSPVELWARLRRLLKKA